VPDIDYKVYRVFGEGVKLLYKNPVLMITKPELEIGKSIELNISKPLEVINGSLVLMESIEDYGQLVEEYTVEYVTVENKTAQEKGSSIGHKRIHSFPKELYGLALKSVSIKIIKLVTEGTKIRLREIAVYDWSEAARKGYLDDKKDFLKDYNNNNNNFHGK
jgi:hypothetical protein